MQTSRSGKLFRCCREAMVLTAYQDGRHCSIGFGSNSPHLRLGDTITVAEAFVLLNRDTAERDEILNRALKVRLTQVQYDALGSFYYQNGNKPDAQGRPGFSTLVGMLNGGRVAEAAAALPGWDRNSAGEALPGLRRRRLLEQALFTKGDYGDLSEIPFWPGDPKTTLRQTYRVKPEDLA
jgi:GH24 family phage-related lysozyme (muramidase)